MNLACPSSFQKRHGIATLMAIVLIGLVGATLAGMAVFSGNELKRTRRLTDEARLRQLLLAGAADTVSRSREWKDATPTAAWSLVLPDELASDAKVKVQCKSVGEGIVVARILAQYENHVMQQTLRFQLLTGAWKLASTELQSPDS